MCNGVFRSGCENDAHVESKPDDGTDTSTRINFSAPTATYKSWKWIKDFAMTPWRLVNVKRSAYILRVSAVQPAPSAHIVKRGYQLLRHVTKFKNRHGVIYRTSALIVCVRTSHLAKLTRRFPKPRIISQPTNWYSQWRLLMASELKEINF
jgi:hypothetical protein